MFLHSRRCIRSNPQMVRSRTMTRQELYEAVWSKPVSELAKEYGVSEYILWNSCKRNDIPRPGLHYWHRVQRGGKTEIPPLPALRWENPVIIVPHVPYVPLVPAGAVPSAPKGRSLDDFDLTVGDQAKGLMKPLLEQSRAEADE